LAGNKIERWEASDWTEGGPHCCYRPGGSVALGGANIVSMPLKPGVTANDAEAVESMLFQCFASRRDLWSNSRY